LRYGGVEYEALPRGWGWDQVVRSEEEEEEEEEER
jgi:hypothetical protein